MSALARVLESFGLATVALSLIRTQAETMRPPRALHCEFPLGRPLGRPGDQAFQHRVLRAAFSLLQRGQGPVLEDFPDVVEAAADADQPLSCPLPVLDGAAEHPATAEVVGVRDAYDRHFAATLRTGVGRATDADGIKAAVNTLVAVADGHPPPDGMGRETIADLALDVRSYFEEAAIELSGHLPAARQVESWFFQQTHAGKLLLRVKRELRLAGWDRSLWWGIAPLTQEPDEDRAESWRESRRQS